MSAASKRPRLSVPAADTATQAWLDAQVNASVSMRLVIHDWIARNGYGDVTCMPSWVLGAGDAPAGVPAAPTVSAGLGLGAPAQPRRRPKRTEPRRDPAPQPKPEPDPQPKPESEPQPQPKPESEPDPKSDPKPEPQPQPSADPFGDRSSIGQALTSSILMDDDDD